MTAVFDPVLAAAEMTLWLHQLGVATTGTGDIVTQAAAALLQALGVDPVDEHRPIRYRVRLVEIRQEGTAVDELHAEDFAHALRMTGLCRTGRASVMVEAVVVPAMGAVT